MQFAIAELGFYAKVCTKLPKCTFLHNLRAKTQEGNMETRQITSFFSNCFSTLTVSNIYFLSENKQNSSSSGPSFNPKYPTFGWKLTSRIAHQIFLELRHPDVTKNSYYVLSPKGSQKRYQLIDLKKRNELEKH